MLPVLSGVTTLLVHQWPCDDESGCDSDNESIKIQ